MEEILPTANQEMQPQQPLRKPDNYLPWAILTTLFCCLPFGIVAIIYSSRVDSEWSAGRYDEAIAAASSAKTWTWVSFGIGASGVLIYLIGVIFVALAAVAGSL